MATAKTKKTDQDTPEAATSTVTLTLPIWDSKLQQAFSAGDVYPCSEDEAARLITNGAAVSADA